MRTCLVRIALACAQTPRLCVQFFFKPHTFDQELRMYEELLAIRPRIMPELHEHARNTAGGPIATPPAATSTGYQFPSFLVMDRGESLRDFVCKNSETPPDLVWLHSLHALTVLVRHLQVRAQSES